MFGFESMIVGVWVTLGDGFCGSAAVRRVEDERPALADESSPVTCLSCGSTKNEHGELPCGH